MKSVLILLFAVFSFSASALETGGYWNDVYVMKLIGYFGHWEPKCPAMKDAAYREFKQMFEPLREEEIFGKPAKIRVLLDEEFKTTIHNPETGRTCTLLMPAGCGRATCK